MGFQPWQYIAARMDRNFLKSADDAVRDDDELVTIAVQAMSSIEYASDRLKAHKPTALLAVRNDALAIQHVSEELRDDDDVVRAAVENPFFRKYDWWCCARGTYYSPTSLGGLSCASDRLRDDYDIVMASVRVNGYSLSFASDRLRDNDEIVLEALKSTSYKVLRLASTRIRSSRQVVKDAAAAGNIEDISPKMLTKELVELAVRKRPSVYSELSSNWRDDDDILKIAIEQDGSKLEFANDRQKSNYDFVKIAIETDPNAIKFAAGRIKNKSQLIELAVSKRWLLPEKYFTDTNLVLENLKNIKRYRKNASGERVLFFDDWYSGDWLKKIAVKQSASKEVALAVIESEELKSKSQYFVLFDDSIKNDLEFCRRALMAVPSLYEHLPSEMKENRDLALYYAKHHYSPKLEMLPESFLSDVEIVKNCLINNKYNIDELPPQFADLPEAFRAKVLRSFDGSCLTDQDLESLYANPGLLGEAAEENPRIFMLRRGLQNDRDALLKAARRAQSDYGSKILDELASDYEVLMQLEFIPENIPPKILADPEFIKMRVVGGHGLRGLDKKVLDDDGLVKLYLGAPNADVQERFSRIPEHVKKRRNVVLYAISLGLYTSADEIPEKFQKDDAILNELYGWLERNPPAWMQ